MSIKRRNIPVFLMLLAILAVLLLTGSYYANRPLKAPKNETLNSIRMINGFIFEAQLKSGRTIVDILDREYPGGQDYNLKLAKWLDSKIKGHTIRQTHNGEMHLFDSWDNQLLLLPRDVALRSGFSSNLPDDVHLVIWSSGPNGKNEFGQGDDIRVEYSR